MMRTEISGTLVVHALLLAVLELAACDPTKPNKSDDGHEVLVFSQKVIVLDHLGIPTAPPVTVGSVVRSSLLESDAPAIVAIDHNGFLVPLQNGHATIRSKLSGSELSVDVSAAARLTLEPSTMELKPGERAPLLVFADGRFVLPSDITWLTSNPATAVAEKGYVAGSQPGSAEIVARYGGSEASTMVTVRSDRSQIVQVAAQQPRIARGFVTQVRLSAPPGTNVIWTSSNENVLRSMTPGLFYAAAPGRALACAEGLGSKSCAAIAVFEPSR